MVAVGPRARRAPARPQPRRREHGRRHRLDAAGRRARPRRRSTGISDCSRSTSSGSTAVTPELKPAGDAARQPVPRPARPLRRARDDRRPLGGDGVRSLVRSRKRCAAAGAQRRRSADRRPRPRRAERHLLRRRGRHAGDARDAARRPTPSTAAAAARPTPTTRSTSATSATTAARRAASSARTPRSRAEQITLHGTRGADVHARHAGRQRERRAAAAGALQRLQRVGRRRAMPGARASRWSRSSPACTTSRAAFGRAERSRSATSSCQILLIKNPAGANEILRTLALEHERARPARDPQRQDRRRARRLVGLGRRLRAARGRACAAYAAPAHAPPSSPCGSNTPACPADRLHVVPALAAALDEALADVESGACSRCPPTRRCSSCGTSSPRADTWSSSGRPEAVRPAMTRDLARPRVRPLRRGPAAVARRWRPSHGDPVLDVGAGTGRVTLGSRPRRPSRSRRSTATRRSLPRAALGGNARRRAGPVRRSCADARDFDARRRALSTESSFRCRRSSCSAGRPDAPRSCVRALAHLRPGGVLAIAIAEELEVFEVTDGVPFPLPDIRELDGVVYSASRPRSAPTGTASCSSAGGRRSRAAGERTDRAGPDSARPPDRRRARARGAAPPASRGRPGERARRPTTTSGARW